LLNSRLTVRPFAIFLGRVYYRQVVVHLAERMGLGVLIACGVVLPILAVGLYRGWALGSVGSDGIIGGAIAGLLWGVLSRPSRLSTAMKADAQLEWNDLLSSALLLQSLGQSDQWAQAVERSADEKCVAARASSVNVGRLGGRSWAGIALAALVVIVPAMLPASGASNIRREKPIPALNVLSLPEESASSLVRKAIDRRMANQPDPDDAQASRMASPDSGSTQPGEDPGAKSDHDADAQGHHPGLDRKGTGSGASFTNASRSSPIRNESASVGTGRSTPQGAAAGGIGASSGRAEGGALAEGQLQNNRQKSATATPAWQSSNWPDDSRRGIDAADSGAVPDAYRDIVRAYFDRP
jgi:hypothetical protein